MNNSIQRHETNTRMSGVVVANGMAYLAGQVPRSSGASITEQTGEILTRIEALLAVAGSDKSLLVNASVWLTDAKHFGEFNAVWDAWVPQGCAPARACVQAGLMRPGIDVEIAVVAMAGTGA